MRGEMPLCHMAQQLELELELAALILIQLLADVPGMAEGTTRALEPHHLCGRQGCCIWLWLTQPCLLQASVG